MALVKILPGAEADLFDIWGYIALDDVEAADAFVRRIHEVHELVAENPKMGRSREELAARLRSFSMGNYVIYYRPLTEDASIEVVRILQAAQDIRESRF